MKKLFTFASLLVTALAAAPALAQEAHAGGGGGAFTGLAAAIAISVAALGGALGQGRAVAAAMDGISRNPAAQPKLFVPMIIGLAFMETLVIFALVIAFQLAGKA